MMYARLSEILAIIYRAGHDDGRFGNPALLKKFAKLEPGAAADKCALPGAARN